MCRACNNNDEQKKIHWGPSSPKYEVNRCSWTLVQLLYVRGHVLLVFSGLRHRFSCFCEVFLWYTRQEEGNWKEKCESSPSTLNGAMRDDGWWQYTLQRKMRFLSNGPPPLVQGPSHSCLYHGAPPWEPLEAPGPHQAALLKWRAVTVGCLNHWAPLLGLWPGSTGNHRETVEVFSCDVACRTVLIWTECDNSKLPPTKGTVDWGKLSHSGQHND